MQKKKNTVQKKEIQITTKISEVSHPSYLENYSCSTEDFRRSLEDLRTFSKGIPIFPKVTEDC